MPHPSTVSKLKQRVILNLGGEKKANRTEAYLVGTQGLSDAVGPFIVMSFE